MYTRIPGICAVLGDNAAYIDNTLPTFWDKLYGPIFEGQEIQEDFFSDFLTDSLSRNVDNGLPLYAAWFPRRAEMSSTSRRMPEITHHSPSWKANVLMESMN